MKMSQEVNAKAGVNANQSDEGVYENELKLESRWNKSNQDPANPGEENTHILCGNQLKFFFFFV